MDLKELVKKISKGTQGSYTNILSSSTKGSIKEYIPSDFYDLNRIATGNLFNLVPRGKIVGIAAPEGTGKTILLMNIIKHAQKLGYIINANESEGAWDNEWVKRWGVDPDKILYTFGNTIEDFRISAENFEGILKEDKGKNKYFWCLDSLGSMTLRRASEAKPDGKVYVDQGLLQRHIKEAFKLLQRICTLYDVPFVFTNHLTASKSVGLYSQADQMVGGYFPRLASWMIYYLSKATKKEEKEVVGQLITAKSIKNRSQPPFQNAVVDLDYRKGINIYAGMGDLAAELEFFEIRDKRYVVPDVPGEKIIWEIDEKTGKEVPTNGKKYYGVALNKNGPEIFTEELLKQMNDKLQFKGYHSVDIDLKLEETNET